uniref:lysozyme n=1 Tax=Meloidogyne incognita TaxID=6306 RepID=A0A914NQB0_MELIC
MLFVVIKSQKALVPNKKCLDCICFVESQCKPLKCKWDDDAVSCGYLQVWIYYVYVHLPNFLNEILKRLRFQSKDI